MIFAKNRKHNLWMVSVQCLFLRQLGRQGYKTTRSMQLVCGVSRLALRWCAIFYQSRTPEATKWLEEDPREGASRAKQHRYYFSIWWKNEKKIRGRLVAVAVVIGAHILISWNKLDRSSSWWSKFVLSWRILINIVCMCAIYKVCEWFEQRQ